MTAKRDPSTHKKRGRKPTMTNQEVFSKWRAQLNRAIHAASTNLMVIKQDSFWTIKEIRARWGNQAVREFKYWFEARRHYDAIKADELMHEFETGRLTPAQYNQAQYTHVYTWMWTLRDTRARDVWQLTRSLQTIDELTREWTGPEEDEEMTVLKETHHA